MTHPIYAVGDIHGQAEQLRHALDCIRADGGADAPIVFLGDYIDRGPDSKDVIAQLVTGARVNANWIFLKGNHDRMMEWFLHDPPVHDPNLLLGFHWLHDRIGGRETLASYGLTDTDGRRMFELAAEARECVPQEHVDFLNDLVLHHRSGSLFFAHAGIRPGVALDAQDEEDLLWIRDEFHSSSADHGALIVHGHTPVHKAAHYGNRINLDSGAGYGYPLTVAVFEGTDCWTLGADGRRKALKP